MAYYKITKQTSLNKFVPERINIFGGIGSEVVKMLDVGDIVEIIKIDSTDYEKGFIKGTYYFTPEGYFLTSSDFVNPLTDQVSKEDIAKYTLKKVLSITEKPAEAIMSVINPNFEKKIDLVAVSKGISDATVIKSSDVITTYQGDNPISNEELIKQLPQPSLYQKAKNVWYIPVGIIFALLIYRKFKKE